MLCDRRDLEVYSYDATLQTSLPDVVVLPRSTEDVVAVVAACAARGVPVTPRGSATSLSGGPIPVRGGVVLSLTRMADVLEVDEDNLRAVVQPGLINADLDAVVSARGLMYAPDPASQIACSMGGNVAENAGGPHCLKYGVTANHVTGLTVVTADAEVVRLGGLSLLDAGLDLRGLVIGSEGTLGVVTEITCRLLPQPPALITMLACFGAIEDAAAAVADIIAAGLLPATLEMIDRVVIEAIEVYDRVGYPQDVEAVLVVEIDGLAESLRPQAERVQETCGRHGVLRFEWAEEEQERERLWRGRKGATAALSLVAPAKFSTDVTLPRSKLPQALAEITAVARRFGLSIGNVFHAGDGNLHPQVLFDPRDQEQMARAIGADEAVTEMALRLGGVLTGEHGIGSQKRKWMTRAYSAHELRAMWAVKKAFDPAGILNPGKVLPDEEDVEALAPLSVSEALQEARPGPVSPATEAEAVDLLAAALRDGVPLHAPDQSVLERPDCMAVRLDGLAGVLDYDASNLTITVGAGMTLGALQEVVADKGQTVGLWRRENPELSVGSLVATARPTPALTRYGAARDIVTGLRVAAGGHLLRLGSSCVKNVSGYALERLFVGSFCSLGLLLAVTLRTHPLPEAEADLLLGAPSAGAFDGLCRELARSPAAMASVTAWPTGVAPYVVQETNDWVALLRLAGWEAEVAESLRLLEALASAHECRVLYAGEPTGAPRADRPALAATQAPLFALARAAAVRFAVEHPGDLRELWPLAGLLRLPDAAIQPEGLADARRLPGSAADLYADTTRPSAHLAARLKQAFDPAGLLPPWQDGGRDAAAGMT